MSGDEREDRIRELGAQLGWDFNDYCVYTTRENPKWVVQFIDTKIRGQGDTIAQAEEDLINKLEKYIDEGGGVESGSGETGETQGT